jgi:hypothetical protein
MGGAVSFPLGLVTGYKRAVRMATYGARMSPGDLVEIFYPDGTVGNGRIADLSEGTACIRIEDRPEYGAIIVHARRLAPNGPSRWWLDV